MHTEILSMNKRGVSWSKGCLPLLAWSSKSSSPSPSSSPTTLSNTGSIRRKRNNEKKAIVKQKNQSAQKNVNIFLLNTREETKKGIPSFGFGVKE